MPLLKVVALVHTPLSHAGTLACLSLHDVLDISCAHTGRVHCSQQSVAWALQLSDLHLSVFNNHWLPQYGDKEGDLQ